MAEPDEALTAFREWYSERYPASKANTLKGCRDLTADAEAYLAGAAASEARIKELEARVAELEADDAIEWRKAAALMRQFFLAGREADQ